ncbi:cysteine desulfurase-like protein [Planctomycetota bacterium]
MLLNDEMIQHLRGQFPALARRAAGREAVFLDGPAGTQVPISVVEAIGHYLTTCNANSHGAFDTSAESDAMLDAAHQGIADFLGAADKDCVTFGPNMTTMTLALSRAIGRTWKSEDEILLSGLEHDANFTPWILAAEDAGATVRITNVNAADCTLDMDDLRSKLNEQTRLVAVGCASNASGSINPVAEICSYAREVGALSFLDAVHFAPHDLIDVEEFGCDFLACSAYKFFGPHIGIVWGRREWLESIHPYKLRPSPNDLPGRWMTGTQNHECMMGTLAAVDYIAKLGQTLDPNGANRRDALKTAYNAIRTYERELCDALLDGLATNDEIKIWGITDPANRMNRLPTVSVTHARFTAKELATRLNDAGIFAWHGNYYALPLTERIDVEPDGMVRLGLVHYNTKEEVDYLLAMLNRL